MELELLKDLKDYFSDDFDDEQEGVLLVCIKRSIKSFKNKRNYPSAYPQIMIEKDMDKYYSCLLDLSLYWAIKQGYEFQGSHSENSTNRSWESESEIYSLHNVIPIARIL